MKTLGKIAGGVGLWLVVSSALTVFVAPAAAFVVQLVVGVALVVFWAVTNGERLGAWAKSAFFFGSSAVFGLVFIALLAAANYVVFKRGKTWDLTDKKIYSLSQQTKDTLKELSEPVKALVFIAGPTPESVDNLFGRYAQETDKLSFEIKDPRRDPALSKKYGIKENQAVAVLIRGQGPTESHTTASLAAIASAAQGEQELTNALVRLSKVGEQKVYFTTGHGEWPLDAEALSPQDAVAALVPMRASLVADGYTPAVVNFAAEAKVSAIAADAATVIIAGPKTAFAPSEVKWLETYLDEGGRVLFFADPGREAGLDALLARYGIELDNGLVASAIDEKQPYVAVAPFFGDHPIVHPLKAARANLLFGMTRSLTRLRGEGLLPQVTATVLLMTTPNAWVEAQPTEHPTLDMGEKTGQLPLAIAAVRELGPQAKRASEARLVVFGSSQLLNAGWSYDPDRNLVLNALAWASNQPKKLTIRPTDRALSTINIDDARMAGIIIAVMVVLPTLLIGLGLTISRDQAVAMSQQGRMVAQLGVVLVAAMGLGAYAYFGVFKKDQTVAVKQSSDERLVPIGPVVDAGGTRVDFTRLVVTNENETTQLVRVKGSPWQIVKPLVAEVDPLVIDALVSQLQQAKFKTLLDENPSDADLEKYGLRTPLFSVEASAGSVTVKLEGGLENTFDGSIYMRRNGEKPVYLAEGGVRWSLAKSTFDLRKKEVLDVPDAELAAIEVKGQHNTYRLERAADQTWHVATFGFDADATTVNGMLGTLRNAKAASFDPPDEPIVSRATFTMNDGKTVRFAFGPTTVVREDDTGTIKATIGASAASNLDRNPIDLFDKTVLKFKPEAVARIVIHPADGREFEVEKRDGDAGVQEWHVKGIGPAKTFKVTQLVWVLSTLELNAFVMKKVAAGPAVRWFELYDAKGASLGRFSIGREVPGKPNVFYVSGTNVSTPHEMSGARFNELPTTPSDLLEAFDAGG